MANDGDLLTAAFLQVFDSFVKEHGCTSPGELAICRNLAALLTDDSTGNDPVATARAIANLTELLPPKKSPGQINRIEVELVSPSGPAHVRALEVDLASAHGEIRRLQRELHELKHPGAASDLPPANAGDGIVRRIPRSP